MRRHYRYLLALVGLLCIGVLAYGLWSGEKEQPAPTGPIHAVGRAARIDPDYSGMVIPPNIAPLDFSVREEGSGYYVKIYSKQGPPIEVRCRSGRIVIPESSWGRLLEANRGEEVYFDIFVERADSAPSSPGAEKQWSRFDSVVNRIAREDIDGFLVYRRIDPAHSTWRNMGVYQRNLRGFDESIVLDNGYFGGGCVNCHTFCNNRTDKVLIGIRSPKYGNSTLLVDGLAASKIDAKFTYTSWHPSGRLAAYSINHVSQFFHTAQEEVRDVVDLDSLLAYYLVETGEVKTTPAIAKKERLETYPAWSPDGRYLYFCSAPKRWTDKTAIPDSFNEIKYDLARISYDLESDKWGEVETVLSAQETGLSIMLPRISPDGRWLLFCMCDYGCFPVYRASSDLYMIDLRAAEQSGRYEYRRLSINSNQSESWHSFSSNSRWIAFSSKRKSGVFTRTYISYLDEEGGAFKPLLLPQKDPSYYDSCLWTYSVPELVCEPVRVVKEDLGRIARGPEKASVGFPVTMATPKAGTSSEPWRSNLPERE
ncbi:MAG: PD40 domain-containing protein [Sedimentisphaerales bacterium]|nr:PD40 domain-containing protein [Sedimentisphaerales bacterium]